jgi:hypothetical protein
VTRNEVLKKTEASIKAFIDEQLDRVPELLGHSSTGRTADRGESMSIFGFGKAKREKHLADMIMHNWQTIAIVAPERQSVTLRPGPCAR